MPPAPDDPEWVTVQLAAAALKTSEQIAYRLSRRENWRHDGGRPRRYYFPDVMKTYKRRTTR